MSELVREQIAPRRGARSVHTGGETDVAAPGEGESRDVASCGRRRRIVVHPHLRQIRAGAGLEEPAVTVAQRLTTGQGNAGRSRWRRAAGWLPANGVRTARGTPTCPSRGLVAAARLRPRLRHPPGEII